MYPQFSSLYGLGRVALGGFLLGFLFSFHLCLLLYLFYMYGTTFDGFPLLWAQWCLYFLALVVFHMSEFLATAIYKPENVSFQSFLLDHSQEYQLATVASWIEFWCEALWIGTSKGHTKVFLFGMCLMVTGELMRILAMHTAKSNFSHRIEHKKRKNHQLVTHGVYKYIRHPSYCGWFVFTIGTQITLCNPICLLLYTFISWHFFKDRIPYEEHLLMDFFPTDYPSYRNRTWCGVPFI